MPLARETRDVPRWRARVWNDCREGARRAEAGDRRRPGTARASRARAMTLQPIWLTDDAPPGCLPGRGVRARPAQRPARGRRRPPPRAAGRGPTGRGIFPWYSEGQPILWWPPTRAPCSPPTGSRSRAASAARCAAAPSRCAATPTSTPSSAPAPLPAARTRAPGSPPRCSPRTRAAPPRPRPLGRELAGGPARRRALRGRHRPRYSSGSPCFQPGLRLRPRWRSRLLCRSRLRAHRLPAAERLNLKRLGARSTCPGASSSTAVLRRLRRGRAGRARPATSSGDRLGSSLAAALAPLRHPGPRLQLPAR